jgi:hypothetical protein
MLRIGTKKLSVEIDLFKKRTIWHTGRYTLNIFIVHWDEHEQSWMTNKWWLIPIFGKRIKEEDR